MPIDHDKLAALADTLTDDQRRLLREGLAGDDDLDPDTLSESLRSFDSHTMFRKLDENAPGARVSDARAAAAAPPDAGVPDGGTDAGTVDGGTDAGTPKPPPKPKPEPPLTRW